MNHKGFGCALWRNRADLWQDEGLARHLYDDADEEERPLMSRRLLWTLATVAALAVPPGITRAQDSLTITGFVQGTTALSIANDTTFIDWDYDQPLENALLAILDIFSNAASGYEIVLVNLDVTEEQAFEFDLLYGDQVLNFQGQQAVLSRVSQVEGSQTQGPRALRISAPPKTGTSQNATVSLQLVVKAP
jgi:hypothetical protein